MECTINTFKPSKYEMNVGSEVTNYPEEFMYETEELIWDELFQVSAGQPIAMPGPTAGPGACFAFPVTEPLSLKVGHF